jgi:deoxyribodipyrimidine photo-lyase
LQTKKFDPQLKYVRKWVPEFESFDYVKPIVDHEFARNRALGLYKKTLSGLQ